MLSVMFSIVLLIPMGFNELSLLSKERKEYLYRNRAIYWLFGNLLFIYFLIVNLEIAIDEIFVYIIYSIVVIKYASYKIKKNTFIKRKYVNSKITIKEIQFLGNELPNGLMYIFIPIYIYMVINIEDFTMNGFNKSLYLSMFIFFIVVMVERYLGKNRIKAKKENKIDISKKKYLIKTNKTIEFVKRFKSWEMFLDETYGKEMVLIVEDMEEAEKYIHLSMDVIVSDRKEDIKELIGSNKELISFYFDNDKCNNKILVYKGLKHIFINKGLDYKELKYDDVYSKCDYIFVSGEEALNKYIKFDSEIKKETIKIIGVPNEKEKIEKYIEIEKEEVEEDSINIIYMPTWEGESEDRNNTSIAKVKELLEMLKEDIKSKRVVLTIRFNDSMGYRDVGYLKYIKYVQMFYVGINKELFDNELDEEVSIEDLKSLDVFKGITKDSVKYSSSDNIYDDLSGKDIIITDMFEEIEEISYLNKSIYVMNMKNISNEEFANKYDYIKNITPIKDFKEVILEKEEKSNNNEYLLSIKEKEMFEKEIKKILI